MLFEGEATEPGEIRGAALAQSEALSRVFPNVLHARYVESCGRRPEVEYEYLWFWKRKENMGIMCLNISRKQR